MTRIRPQGFHTARLAMVKPIVALLFMTIFLSIGCFGHRQEVLSEEEPVSAEDGVGGQGSAFFEQGLQHANAAEHDAAVSAFQKAIAQQEQDRRLPDSSEDVVAGYFPHRELGIVYYRMEKLPEAEDELEISIRQYPSAKAYYYRDLVRKAAIEESTAELHPPEVRLDMENDVWTRDDPVVLTGSAEDPLYVSRLEVDGEPVYLDGSRQRVDFNKSLRFSQGSHKVEIVAANLTGKETRRFVTIHVDRDGPVIRLEEIRPENDRLRLTGSLHDPAGIAELLANGDEVRTDKGADHRFQIHLDSEEDELRLESFDKLGNRTAAVIPLHRLTAQIERPLMLAASDTDNFRKLLETFSMRIDNNPPEIRLVDWEDHQIIFLEKIYLDGLVQDKDNLVRFSINGKPVVQAPGKLVVFNHLVELEEGGNTILLEAEDVFGNRAERRLHIERRIPSALQLKERLRLGVFPFVQLDAISALATSFQDNLIAALLRRNRFRIVDRSLLDLVLKEQKTNGTRLADPATRLAVGKLIAAQSIVSGSIVENNSGIEIICRVVDAETKDILATAEVFSAERSPAEIRFLARRLAVKIHREFPLVEGAILKRDGRTIFTDLGDGEISVQRRILVFKESPLLQLTGGKPVGTDHRIVGRARIVQVSNDLSKAELSPESSTGIDRSHRVIAE